MSNLIQLVYISRATIETTQNDYIVPEVAKILRVSRHNNRARNIVGALYYGNGFFFQCLEGEEQAVQALYEILKTDPRHRDLKIISKKSISERSFGNWEMKYLPAEEEVQKLLRTLGLTHFDPYQFDEAKTNSMLQLLVRGANLELSEAAQGAAITAARSEACSCTIWKISTALLALALIAELVLRHGA